MKTERLNYKLNPQYIAQYPPSKRGRTNLLVYNRADRSYSIKKYQDFAEYLKPGDVLVLNNTKVEKYRLFALNKRNKRRVQVLLLNKVAYEHEQFDSSKFDFWYALIGFARHVKLGDELIIENGNEFSINVIYRNEGDPGFILAIKKDGFDKVLEKYGHTPLPPYIKREDTPEDYKRYNTVFAKIKGSVAAPTASLNITKKILQGLKKKGVNIAYVDLQVGWGTFSPIRTENVEDFKIHEEFISVSKDSAQIINETILNGGQVFSVGTTASRTLETIAYWNKERQKYLVKAFDGFTDIFIYPGYKWKVVNHLITNFHAPKTSLLALVASFIGSTEEMFRLYDVAFKNNFKVLSYGDSMLIL